MSGEGVEGKYHANKDQTTSFEGDSKNPNLLDAHHHSVSFQEPMMQ